MNCTDFPAEDCDARAGAPPAGVNTCDLDDFDADVTGICIPHIDAGWHTALVKMAFPEEGLLQCPDSAQWAGLFGQEVVDPATEPRDVIGCSVNPLATCSSLSWACVPFEADFAPCVLQTDQNVCPDPYLFQTRVVPHGGGATATVCCAQSELD